MNPYRAPFDLWPEEVSKAHQVMPRTPDGFVINPRYAPSGQVQRDLSVRWREWSRRFARHLWPTWLEGWFAEAKGRGLTT